MFFLRCAFFLSIVYLGILGEAGFLRMPAAFGPSIANEASQVADAVVTHTTDWCAKRPAQCVRDAARLDVLLQSTTSPTAGGDETVLAVGEARSVPLPVPDPRRHAFRSVLTGPR